MYISTVQEALPYRLIRDRRNHFAVVEARCGLVYPIHYDCQRPRPEACDTPDGMAGIIQDEWSDEASARDLFSAMVESEQRWSEVLR